MGIPPRSPGAGPGEHQHVRGGAQPGGSVEAGAAEETLTDWFDFRVLSDKCEGQT